MSSAGWRGTSARHCASVSWLGAGAAPSRCACGTWPCIPRCRGLSIFPARSKAPISWCRRLAPSAVPHRLSLKVVSVLLSFVPQGVVIRYWAIVTQAGRYRLQRTPRRANRESFEGSRAILGARSVSHDRALSAPQDAVATRTSCSTPRRHHDRCLTAAVRRAGRGGRESSALCFVLRLHVGAQRPLWSELEFLRPYLSIEHVQFEDRLRVRITADPAGSDASSQHVAAADLRELQPSARLVDSEEGGGGRRTAPPTTAPDADRLRRRAWLRPLETANGDRDPHTRNR